MDNTPLISVIVPVYKVEPYLDRCIQSIVNQTYPNLEIILVDDGSPDNCGAMCDAWAAKDSRIKVIHQQNAGGGAARNAALDIAKGEMLAFVDSDDYLAEDMFEHLYQLLVQGADIAECAYINAYDDSVNFNYDAYRVKEYSVAEAMLEHIHDRYFRQLIWNKLYHREVIGNIRFPVGMKIDDEFFTYRVLGNAQKLIRSNKVCYAYRQQADSVMHSMSTSKRVQAVEAKMLRQQYIEENFPELACENLKNLWFTCIYQGQIAFQSMDQQSVKRTIRYLNGILKKYPLDWRTCNGKVRLWVVAAKYSLQTTCRLRNWLQIGL